MLPVQGLGCRVQRLFGTCLRAKAKVLRTRTGQFWGAKAWGLYSGGGRWC